MPSPSPRLQLTMPREGGRGDHLGAAIASLVLTVGFVVAMAISVRGYHHEIESGPRVPGEPVTREQVTFVRPRVVPPPVVPPPRVTQQPRAVAPATVAATPSVPLKSDSASSAAPPSLPTRSVPGDATPAAAPAGARAPASSCVGPCDSKTTVGIRSPVIDDPKNSTMAALADAMRDAAATPPHPSGMGGVSINVGLPGGGPTRAQRKRDSTINADVTARLDRIRERADSVKKDSVARAKKP